MTHPDKKIAGSDPATYAQPWRTPAVRRVATPLRLSLGVMADNIMASMPHRRPARLLAHVGYSGTLSKADRELVILRTTWTVRGYFPYASHAAIARIVHRGRDAQLAVQYGPDHPDWTPRESAMLRFVDDLQRDLTVSESTRTEVEEHFSQQQLMAIAGIIALYEATCALISGLGFRMPAGLGYFVRGKPIPRIERGPLARRGNPATHTVKSTVPWAVPDPTVHAAADRDPRMGRSLRKAIARSARHSALTDVDTSTVIARVVNLATNNTTAPVPQSQRCDTLSKMVDELFHDRFVCDDTWSAATEFFTDRELADFCTLVGMLRLQYFLARA